MEIDHLVYAVEVHYLKWGSYALSVYSLAGLSADQLAVAEGQRLPYGKIREATVGAIRGLDCDVIPWGTNGYAQICFPSRPSQQSFERLCSVFAAARSKW